MNSILYRSAILFFSFFLWSGPTPALAEQPLPAPLLEIDAQRFESKPIQKSKSGRIYLFQAIQVIPKTGNLILLYEQDRPIMAFRVLKNDRWKKQFVGKRVRRYDQVGELAMNQAYSSIEKISDVLPGPPVEGVEGSNSTQENLAPAPQDTELDSASPKTMDQIDEYEAMDEDDQSPLEIDETPRVDPFNNIITFSAGYFGNASNFSTKSVNNNGFSLSYAHTLIHDLFVAKKIPQDSFSLELGLVYYRIINMDGGNDFYSMLPFFANGLYQLHLSHTFSLNFYGGIQYNYMTSATNPGRSVNILQGPQPNFGLGFFYTMGPQWLLRADIGWDRMSGGLSIKW